MAASRIDELAQQCHFLGANDPATFVDRDEVLVGRNGSGRRGYRRPWIGISVAAISGVADALSGKVPPGRDHPAHAPEGPKARGGGAQ